MSNELVSFSVDWKAPNSSLFDVMTAVDLISLEESPSSLFGGIGKILMHKENIFVLTINGDQILKFSKEGKFLKSVKQLGDGPEEYRILRDIIMHKEHIFGLDNEKQRVLRWDHNLNFKSSHKLGFWSDRFHSTKNGFLFDTKFHLVNDSAFNLIFTDEDFQVTGGALPFNKPRGLIMGGVNVFNQVNEAIQFMPIFNDTVFAVDVDSKTVNPVFRIDYGDLWQFDDQYQTDQEFFTLFDGSSPNIEDMVLYSSFLASGNHILQTVTLHPSNKVVGIKINAQNGAISLIDLLPGDDVRSAIRPIKLVDERIFTAISPDQLEMIFTERKDLRQRFEGKILMNENPMILSFVIDETKFQ